MLIDAKTADTAAEHNVRDDVAAPSPQVILRPAHPDDLDGFMDLALGAGPGFTSLIPHRDMLSRRLENAFQCFQSTPPSKALADYLIFAENIDTGELLGCASVKVPERPRKRFLNYRYVPDNRHDDGYLHATEHFHLAGEVGSLYVSPKARGLGVGKLLSFGRYMLIAQAPHRFPDQIIAELRGMASEGEEPPLWQSLGRSLYKMSFEDADAQVGTGNDEFVVRQTPKTPIPLKTLSSSARFSLGSCHPLGKGALNLLHREGFYRSAIVDLFDGGPIVVCPKRSLRTTQNFKRLEADEIQLTDLLSTKLISNNDFESFRCTMVSQPIASNNRLQQDILELLKTPKTGNLGIVPIPG